MGTVVTSGPLFDGKATLFLQEASNAIEKDVALTGAAMVRAELNLVLRHQTPVYRTKVEAVENRPGWKIWDQKIVYGPWLEGTGSRNRTTRFKGYATFRRTTQKINRRSKTLANEVLRRYMLRMNY